jgi:hypothetical protein
MLVYGDHSRIEDTRAFAARILDAERQVATLPPGIARHAELVANFIEAGELMQGVADAAFAARGHDARWPEQAGIVALLMRIGDAVRRSWDSDFQAPLVPASAPKIGDKRLPEAVEIKRPEGYSFYALYPESYLEAATALAEARAPLVIGIRSIGTGLSALVAAALLAKPPVTVRPCGDPFQRELSLAPEVLRELLAHDAAYAIVDEGPGLSGSSFGAVADALEDGGVARERIHALPSHAGDLGPKASPRHRRRWATLARHCVEFDALALDTPRAAHRLSAWVADLVGPLEGPLEDISGGGWRRKRFLDQSGWPAANVQQERRKFLAHTASGTWLVKFAGLGREGAAKLDRARFLHDAGFTPEPYGFRHGFIVERWMDATTSIDPSGPDRGRFIETVGRYLGFRARTFPAARDRGASLTGLHRMAVHNIAEALGASAADCLADFAGQLEDLESRSRRIETDSRMHAWEWLAVAGGRFVKADALDHHAGHDLVGCQDVAWDVAGAVVELGLSEQERDRVCAIVEREGSCVVDPELLRLLTPCYLAFQLGASTLAAEALVGWPAEAARLKRSAARYADALRGALSPHP